MRWQGRLWSHCQALHLLSEQRRRAVGPGRWLQWVLKVASKLLSVRSKVEESIALLVRLPLLLSHHGQLLMGVLLPLLTETIASKGFVVEGSSSSSGSRAPSPPPSAITSPSISD